MPTDPDRAKNAVRRFNKHVLNPVMLHLAGRKYWYAAVISHVGRRTGRQYATPVVAEPVPDGFLVPLPYGTQVDWLRNVQTAGKATITAKGRAYDVCDPEIVDAATVSALLSSWRRQTFERVGIKSYLKVRTV